MSHAYRSVFVTGTGAFLPGPPVGNDSIDRYIAPLDRTSGRIKRRVLAENGIQTRHYAIDPDGVSLWSNAGMAAGAVRACLDDSGTRLDDVSLLCTGTSGGDAAIPGFANMVQGELGAGPMSTSSHEGICAAGVIAAQRAADAIELGGHEHALVVASEFPSRMFKRSRFAPRGYSTDFDSHFLRWMLSDGAGAALLSARPHPERPSLKVDWIHSRSFAGDYPACMQIGLGANGDTRSYLDYPSVGEAEAAGAFSLRQDMRMLPNLFDVGIHEYAALVRDGRFDPDDVDHFLCHYSSEKFAGTVETLMRRARLSIPRNRWYSNLSTRGNTGAASIFIMLADFLRDVAPAPGEKILCFVPESGRFTVCFLMLEVVAPPQIDGRATVNVPSELPAPPVAPAAAIGESRLSRTLQSLAEIWHDYRSSAWRTPLVRRIVRGELSRDDYLRWMRCWIPQVREGSRWMRAAAESLDGRHPGLRAIVEAHAGDEQSDYRILFDDYRAAGGHGESIDDLSRNPGGEALNAYMYAKAGEAEPLGLLGAIYVIEGTGQRIIPMLLPTLRRQLDLPERAYRFLAYHGANDADHIERWLRALELALDSADPDAVADDVVRTARDTSRLYLVQLENAL